MVPSTRAVVPLSTISPNTQRNLERARLSVTQGVDGVRFPLDASCPTQDLDAWLQFIFPAAFKFMQDLPSFTEGERLWILLVRDKNVLLEAATSSPTVADFIRKSCPPGKSREISHLFLGTQTIFSRIECVLIRSNLTASRYPIPATIYETWREHPAAIPSKKRERSLSPGLTSQMRGLARESF